MWDIDFVFVVIQKGLRQPRAMRRMLVFTHKVDAFAYDRCLARFLNPLARDSNLSLATFMGHYVRHDAKIVTLYAHLIDEILAKNVRGDQAIAFAANNGFRKRLIFAMALESAFCDKA